MKNYLVNKLIENGWTEIQKNWKYQKGEWKVFRDTSSWFIIGSESNPRIFDVPEPNEPQAMWTVNLIEYMCKMEDERFRLRNELKNIKNSPDINEIKRIANIALEGCFHTWLVKDDNLYCPICKKNKT